MDKILTFHIFRYHLNPITNKSQQIELFPKVIKSPEEIKEKKNEFFGEVLEDLNYYKDDRNPLKLEHFENNFYLIKLAQRKSARIVQDFEDFNVTNEPFVYIIINNNPSVQKIAISDNTEAFTKPKVVKNILFKLLNYNLLNYGLEVSIEELFKKETFWNFVQEHRHNIKLIDFKYIRPNLANISKSLPEDFRNFTDNVNSKESHIVVKAPQNGVLENIDKSNPAINGLVEYTSEGAGDIKLQVKGIKKRYSTKENPVTVKISEAKIEGPAEQVIKVYQSLISE
ncbi:hypothetical protein [Flagellimonas nanhaiensis]|uniref:DUF4747 family protein n=1 Tax=Flagellimonas nanhaiensis TaxID=2292706 RepID=A0A371JP92_9FLAO|nr:hypothetical protein [Allomuricauda nanhaiensis]RDY59263.1 hypothetical protein DX873_07640 [Allomuricauda nanhaiensis]